MNSELPRNSSATIRVNKKLHTQFKRELIRNPRYKGMSQGDAVERLMLRVVNNQPV